MILVSCVSCGLVLNNCVRPNPSLYPIKDVLVPNEEVQKCPIGWVKDGKIVNDAGEEIFLTDGIVVNEAFSIWVWELREEIKRLRKLVK